MARWREAAGGQRRLASDDKAEEEGREGYIGGKGREGEVWEERACEEQEEDASVSRVGQAGGLAARQGLEGRRSERARQWSGAERIVGRVGEWCRRAVRWYGKRVGASSDAQARVEMESVRQLTLSTAGRLGTELAVEESSGRGRKREGDCVCALVCFRPLRQITLPTPPASRDRQEYATTHHTVHTSISDGRASEDDE